jgi:hypothetical protein
VIARFATVLAALSRAREDQTTAAHADRRRVPAGVTVDQPHERDAGLLRVEDEALDATE